MGYTRRASPADHRGWIVDRIISPPERHGTVITAAPTDEMLEMAIESLRREWRAGCTGQMAWTMAAAKVKRLRELAVSQQAGDMIDEVDRRLTRYRALPVPERKQELTELAAALNALRPHLRPAQSAGPPVGKLQSAIAPGRRRERSLSVDEQDKPPTVKPLSPTAPITDLPRVGYSLAEKLSNLHLRTVEDVLRFTPRRHIDYSRTVKIGSVLAFGPQDEVTIRGEITDLQEIRGAGRPRVQLRLADETGWMRITFFNTYISKQIRVGDEIAVSGPIDVGYGAPSLTEPEWERLGGPALSTGRLTPVYSLTKGVHQKTLRNLTRAALDATKGTVEEYLPDSILKSRVLMPLAAAYENLHYPAGQLQLSHAETRLSFDNLLLLQLGLIRRKRERKAHGGIPLVVDRDLLTTFYSGLPFSLTAAQHRALDEILLDLTRPQPMTRLLQGDVGSGKTVVAAAAVLTTVANGYQAGVMAPTEILAEQHFHNLRGLYAHLETESRPTVAMLTGATPVRERRRVLAGIAEAGIDVLVGTHALIQEGVNLNRLGLSVVDEQHRFGVRQRSELSGKANGERPHVLSMSATPIPRTLNMVLNGDLDVSIIDELPPGRIPVETRRYFGDEREAAYQLVREQVAKGQQVFVICPLVEESEAIEAKAAVAEAERLKRDVFPELGILTLHGRMSGKNKDAIMTAFRDREADILVSTSVIEVGIDVPNATVMLIEGADRFGLAQLHQFRGRVGRGGSQSYCLLLADESTPAGEERLSMMEETTDGFLLAQKDLELRGPGDFIGTRQSGLPELSWIDHSFDTRLLDQARQTAENLLETDPDLLHPDHTALRARLQLFWAAASPDIPL
ncbi:MAG: ATP-dependent DNA helicase RecG [Thermomicrobiales bacterium]